MFRNLVKTSLLYLLHLPPLHSFTSSFSTTSDSIREEVETLRNKYGRCDVLINNAGVLLEGWAKENFDTSMEINFYGSVRLTNAILPLMIQNGNL